MTRRYVAGQRGCEAGTWRRAGPVRESVETKTRRTTRDTAFLGYRHAFGGNKKEEPQKAQMICKPTLLKKRCKQDNFALIHTHASYGAIKLSREISLSHVMVGYFLY